MQYVPILTLSPIATAPITAHRFVSHGGGVPTAGGNTQGASLSDTPVGHPIPTVAIGTAIVEAGGTFAKDALVESDAEGKAVLLDEGKAAGRALQAGIDGRKVEVLLYQN